MSQEFRISLLSKRVDILEKRLQTFDVLQNKNYQEIGVIATEGTIRSGAWEQKLKEENPQINVINKACPMLATIAEEGKAQSAEGRKVIKQYMKPFKENKINKIISKILVVLSVYKSAFL